MSNARIRRNKPDRRTKWIVAVCCFLLGMVVHGLYQRSVSSANISDPEIRAQTDGAGNTTEPALLRFREMIAKYDLKQVPPGMVMTDKGRSLHAYVARQPYPAPPVDADAPLVRLCMQMQDLVRLEPPSGHYDCHGWVFLGGRGWLIGDDVEMIIQDNGYRPVSSPEDDDLVIYRDAAGHAVHSGIVLGISSGKALVESKWGDQGRYVHLPPIAAYGQHQFYRSNRHGHRLRGWDGISLSVAVTPTSPSE